VLRCDDVSIVILPGQANHRVGDICILRGYNSQYDYSIYGYHRMIDHVWIRDSITLAMRLQLRSARIPPRPFDYPMISRLIFGYIPSQ
jgi:hypothetical protein